MAEQVINVEAQAIEEARHFVSLLDRVDRKNPKPEELAEVQKMLHQSPFLWRIGGDLARINRDALIAKIFTQRGVRESLRRGIELMQNDLGYVGASQLERLLIDQITTNWLRVQWVEYQATGIMGTDTTFTQAEHWDKRLTSAQRRYTQSIEALARVRRLLRPAVAQVNIAEHQVNMAQVRSPNA